MSLVIEVNKFPRSKTQSLNDLVSSIIRENSKIVIVLFIKSKKPFKPPIVTVEKVSQSVTTNKSKSSIIRLAYKIQ